MSREGWKHRLDAADGETRAEGNVVVQNEEQSAHKKLRYFPVRHIREENHLAEIVLVIGEQLVGQSHRRIHGSCPWPSHGWRALVRSHHGRERPGCRTVF